MLSYSFRIATLACACLNSTGFIFFLWFCFYVRLSVSDVMWETSSYGVSSLHSQKRFTAPSTIHKTVHLAKLSIILTFEIYFYPVSMFCLHYVCAACACSACRRQKRESDALKLELQKVVNFYVDTWYEPGSPERKASVNYWAISTAPLLSFLISLTVRIIYQDT